MQYRKLGATGLKVSRICLGTMSFGSKAWRPWVLEEAAAIPIIKAAWERGINFFDTADIYSNGVSEQILGNAVKQLGIARDEIVIATKCFFEVQPLPLLGKDVKNIKVNGKGLSRKHIMDACDASLKRLGTEYIDLYQIHRWDNDTPIEETMEALHDLIKAGKVRYIGASTMHAWQFAKAQRTALLHHWTPFRSMQNLYNLTYREEEREVIPMCKDIGVGVIPWSPLARGFLTGREESVRQAHEKGIEASWFDDSSRAILDVVKAIAAEKKVSCAEVATAWVLAKDGITAPIIGVTKPSHLSDAVNALSLELSAEEIARLEAPYRPRPVMGWHQ